MNSLSHPGTYALLFACPGPIQVRVGALGDLHLAAGYLVYVGSAFGAGGLAGRLRHHLRNAHARPRWHLDYIRPYLSSVGAWFSKSPHRLEHRWATALAHASDFAAPYVGFGSSDCACASHLFHARGLAALRRLRPHLAASTVDVSYLNFNRLQRRVAAKGVR